jgi:hypothetical protein
MKAGDVYLRRRTSAFLVIECENGYYEGGRGGGSAHDATGKVVKKFKGDGGKDHAANFIAGIRSRKPEDLKGEIEKIHYSSAWCHLGNISYRLGQSGDLDQAKAQLADFAPWQELITDLPAHLTANEITLKPGDLRVGQMLEIDAEKETFIGASATPEALALLKREYRPGFEVPEMV